MYNTANRLLNYNGVTYQYDANGNATSRADSCGTTTYTWDSENRLVGVTGFKPDCAVLTASYRYDPLGRRIEKNVNGTVTKYLYDDSNIILEYDGNNQVLTRYSHGPRIDEPLSMEKNGQKYYYHFDGLGSMTEMTDAVGNIVQRYEYDSFGNIISVFDPNFKQPYTYTSREYDEETGLYFYRARYYDAKVGRFISEDPIGFAGGDVNFFAYVGNNPVNRIDPSGLHMVCDQIHGCYFHTSCINNHEHPNRDAAEGRCFDFDPPVNIPPWVCKMGIKAGCNLLCKRLGGDLVTCQATCTAAAELVCPKKCE